MRGTRIAGPAVADIRRAPSCRTPRCAACGSGDGLEQVGISGGGAPPRLTLCRGCARDLREGRLRFRWVETRQPVSKHSFENLTVAGGHLEMTGGAAGGEGWTRLPGTGSGEGACTATREG